MNSSSTPFFTVVVPVYNHERYVAATLDSVLAQTEHDWEVVAVNDGSADGTATVLDAYARRDPRIRVIHKANGGVSTALNRGIEAARGEWLGWLSSDDLFEPQHLAVHRTWIERYPQGRFFFSDSSALDDATGAVASQPLLPPVPPPEWRALETLRGIFINGICTSIHRSVFAEVGLYAEDLRYGQDYDLWLRLLSRTGSVAIPERTALARVHAAQNARVHAHACFFDCATAALRFLNANRFEALVPALDLDDPANAAAALDRALEIAASPHAYLYAFGAHPALWARVLEWAWDPARGAAGRALRREFGRRARASALANRGSMLGTVCKAAAVACEGARVGAATYAPVEPVEVGLAELARRQAAGDPEAEAFGAYLKRFHGQSPARRASVPGFAAQEIAVVGPRAVGGAEPLPGELAEAGHRVLAAGVGPWRFGLRGGVAETSVVCPLTLGLELNAGYRADQVVSLAGGWAARLARAPQSALRLAARAWRLARRVG